MKKFVCSVIVTCLLFTLFAGSYSFKINCGYGGISGTRYNTEADYSHSIKASGLEVGTVVSYMKSADGLGRGVEAYFDYLFADKGSWSQVEFQAPKPASITPDMKYTDYKAGLGYVHRFEHCQYSYGINFAGVSNHKYTENMPKKIENQTDGHKITSFGFYLDTSLLKKLTDHTSLSIGLHGCLNPIGFVRELDTENHKWVNFFNEKSSTLCCSCFAQLGLIYTI